MFPKTEGLAIAPFDTEAALIYWKEALRRRLLLDQSPNCPILRSGEFFRTMISDAKDHPALAARLGELAMPSPELRLLWISQPRQTPP